MAPSLLSSNLLRQCEGGEDTPGYIIVLVQLYNIKKLASPCLCDDFYVYVRN